MVIQVFTFKHINQLETQHCSLHHVFALKFDMTHLHKMPYDKIDEKLPAFHILVVQITIPCINQDEDILLVHWVEMFVTSYHK